VNVASDSTATETTATGDRLPDGSLLATPAGRERLPADGSSRYVGRFAPSPTGDLHLGSLLAAVGSFLDARHHGGQWLLRIEDLDTRRNVPGSTDRILRTLEGFGLGWDGPVIYQSRRLDRYASAADTLKSAGHTFECSCSRREMNDRGDTAYPGTCRAGPTRAGATATRFRIAERDVVLFDDRVQGKARFELGLLGDFVIKRKDGIFSYQLATVVDDAAQAVTDVVRGADLLASSAWQVALRQALKLSAVRYAHLPLVVAGTHEKLAKSRQSVPVDPARAAPTLAVVLRLLKQNPPAELERDGPFRLLDWAVRSWNPDPLRLLHTVAADAHRS
jgi:glutamyl-Q tRNA(Asp) synthetase